MKKSLLGLVLAALTIVGCQNYDDQFDDLNTKITTLTSQVSELSGLSAAIQAVSDRISALEGSTASASQLTEVIAEVNALTEAVAAVQEATAYGEDEVDTLEDEIDEIRGALDELLKQSSVIQQDIVITSAAQLEYVENLMGLDSSVDNTFEAGESREYILSGTLTVDTSFTATDTAMLDRVNAVVDRIASVVMEDGDVVTLTVAADQTLSVASLEFIQGGLTLDGPGTATMASLRALTETLTLVAEGDIVFDALNQVGNVRISATDSITLIDFSNVATSDGQITTADGVLSLPEIDGVVNLGAVGLPASVTLANATSIIAGAVADGVDLSAPDAESVTLNSATSFTADGNITISAKGNIISNVGVASGTLTVTSAEGAIHLESLTAINGAASLTASEAIRLGALESNDNGITADGDTFHVGSLETNEGSLTVTATGYDFESLESNNGGITLHTGVEVIMPALETSSATIVAADAEHFKAIALSTATGTINIANSDATIEVGNLTATTTLLDFATVEILKLHAQEASIDFSSAVSMTSLTVLGKQNATVVAGGQVNDVVITAANAALEDLTVGGTLRLVELNGTDLEEFESLEDSVILDLYLNNNDDLEKVTLAHDRLDGENALAIRVTNNGALESLDMSSVNKIKHIEITGNSSLTAITMAGYSPAVEPTATITVSISGNALSGRYTGAVSGTDTTPYLEAEIVDDSGIICAVKDFVEFYDEAATTGSVTSTVDLDEVELWVQTATVDGDNVTVSSEEADPADVDTLSNHIAADGAVTGTGGATDAIDSPEDYALIDCE